MKVENWKILWFVLAALVLFFPILNVSRVFAQTENVGNQEGGVFVKEFVFIGNTVLDTPTLLSAVEDLENQDLTLDDMNEAAERITLAYQEKGYILARAYIPEQEIEDGILQIAILEGVVGKVKVTGNTYYNDRVVERYFRQQVKEGVIRESLLERGYLLTNDVPKLETEIILEEGETPGTSDVVLKTEDKIGVKWGVDYNNYGSKFTSRNRFGTTLDITEPEFGSNLSFRGVTGDDPEDSSLIALSYMLPVNSYGTKVGAQYLKANYIVGQQFADLGVEGDTEIFGVKISHPLIRARDKNTILTFGFHNKDVEQQLLGSDQSKDELNAFSLGIGFDGIDRYVGKTIVSLEWNPGHVDFKETPPSRLDVDETFTRFNGSLTRIQKIYGYTNLLLRLQGQYSPNRLLPIEQFPLGGYFWVRGHEPATFLGDSGYTFSSEIMTAPPFLEDKTLFNQRVGQLVQLALWFDTGGAYTSKTLPGEANSQYLSGFGGGVRLFYKDRLTFRFDVAFPTDQQEEDEDVYLYFMASINAF